MAVSIDTEEDNWDPAREGVTVENVRELPRLAAFLDSLGARPTYFVNYQVIRQVWTPALLRDIAGGGRGEIGAHVHPWNTPPLDARSWPGSTMLCNYPLEQQAAKIRAVTDAIEAGTGARPTSFRAGRFGLGSATIAALIGAGFHADSSVTPFVSWVDSDGGPDFLGAPLNVYLLRAPADLRTPAVDGSLVEVPVSVGFTAGTTRLWPMFERLFRQRWARALHLPGASARLRLAKRVMLSPETAPLAHMLDLSRRLLAGGVTHLNLSFHSSSLRPGITPFVRNRADVERLYETIARWIEGVSRMQPVVFRTVAEIAAGAAARPSA